MSVPNQTPYIIYNANGLTTVFPFEFYIINSGDIQVSLNGDVLTTGYSVSGVGNVGGGDVTFITPPASGAVVMLERVVPTYRLTDYQDNGDLLADTVNKDFDRLWMAIQRSFIYLGLALRRPLLGGPYDAQGYRIEKGADPVNLQDLATKNYVDNTSLVRALRVPESQVSVLPPASQRANQLLAFNASGQPITVLPASGSASDVLIELASDSGTSMIGRPSGGELQDTIPEFYVDEFGADPTGATSSTAAVNAALAAINSLTDSRMDKSLSVKYAKLIFGKGKYVVGDILIKSGVHYAGQGAYATLIVPENGATACFTTIGTQPYFVGREPARCFRPQFSDMMIGYDLQRIYTTPIPENNIYGIMIKYASYVKMTNVHFNALDGIGLSLAEVWDSDFDCIRFLTVGNARNPANPRWSLMLWSGDTADHISSDNPTGAPQDGCDTLRFRFLHIEGTDAQLYVGPRSKMIFFDGMKLEGGKTSTAVSNIIAGVTGLTMSNPQLSWSVGTLPMFSMIGTGSVTDTSDSDPSANYQGNHNRRVIVRDCQIANSENNTGWYFDYSSDRGPLLVEGGTVHHSRYFLSGKNVHLIGTHFIQSGPVVISTTSDLIMDDVSFYRHRVPSSGSANVITCTGQNNRISRSKFYTPYGSSTDNNTWIVSNSSSELWVNDCEFGGSFGNAIQPGSDANASRCTNNRLMTGASYGNLIVGFPVYGNLPARIGAVIAGMFSESKTIAANASTTITIGGATKLVVRVRDASSAYVGAGEFFTDPNTVVVETADPSSKFSVNGGGATSDGQIWLSQSGGTLTITNRTTTSVTVNIGGLCAEF